MNLVPKEELQSRLTAFRKKMDEHNNGWNVAFIIDKVNLFYLTGTQQNGILVIPRSSDAVFFVRRSYQRAELESNFEKIVKINSFRDIPPVTGSLGKTVYIEKEFVPIAHFERINKYFGFEEIRSCDFALSAARAVKTKYELDIMRHAGILHRKTLEEYVPTVIREGINEKELAADIMHYMLDNGHHGVTRIAMFNTELFLGQVCFGENSMYYNTFDGPGGIKGISPAVPLFGNENRKLACDELVFVDIGFGIEGYHTDKTQVYAFGTLPDEVYEYQLRCVDILDATVSRLKPGAIPSKIYEDVLSEYDEEFLEYFMGVGDERVKFLGHGVGLVIDEYPVIAKGFDLPLEEHMVLAVEPKRGIPGVGLVGLENTYIVTDKGGVSLTGDNRDIIQI
ncbi:peptidase M24 [Denitrovibrio acetiphilus DSM 12809]|uniref:Peptidase M24 n=1 Tax=Denitrovibrio acetiphilus (strain DSM 12809 / NBRC 114555 / N2460) TaxID=522772 RepID=D4H3G1_DENA2|nr:Xaa-Pro peptidase family protein [Denitrovibrio acetiphilus]ADD67245.1 peptidase M24 [Denitrovibrio acetiphilus DSM 12809]